MNYFKTGILLMALTLVLVIAGHMLGGPYGARMAFIFALVMNFGAYWFSDKLVLAMYRARPISESEAPEVYNIARELTQRAALPMPKIYSIPQQAPNAFATGRSPRHATVAVTDGIIGLLNREELKGVLAHELAHVNNRDILTMTIAATLAGAITMLADWARWAAMFGGRDRGGRGGQLNVIAFLVMAVLAPIAAMLIQLAISRSREYEADRTGAQFARSPFGLASALEKLGGAARFNAMNTSPSTAHLFIVNPLRGDIIATLFSTHPPVEERIRRLKAMRG